MNKKQKIALIYRHTHKDYRKKDNGNRWIMPPFELFNETCLIPLEELDDQEFEKLWSIVGEMTLRKEQRRLEQKEQK